MDYSQILCKRKGDRQLPVGIYLFVILNETGQGNLKNFLEEMIESILKASLQVEAFFIVQIYDYFQRIPRSGCLLFVW